MKTLNAFRLAAASVLALGVVNAHAAPMNLSADVIANCTISVSDINFGNYDPIVANKTTPLDVTHPISTTCTIGSSPTIRIDAGLNAPSPTGANRRLSDGTNYLTYVLREGSFTGTTWDIDADINAGTATGLAVSKNIYARLPADQNVPVGSYVDTVQVTVHF